MKEWLFTGQRGFRQRFSCESQELADAIDKGGSIDSIVIDFAEAFDVVPHDILIRKLDNAGIDRRVVLLGKENLNRRTQRVKK